MPLYRNNDEFLLVDKCPVFLKKVKNSGTLFIIQGFSPLYCLHVFWSSLSKSFVCAPLTCMIIQMDETN